MSPHSAEGCLNISSCVFKNISSLYYNSYATVIAYEMGSSSNGDYDISNNIFISVDGAKAAVNLKGSFLSLEFYNNSFFNISSKNYGGVYLFIFCFTS
jgi:hypothetical protein